MQSLCMLVNYSGVCVCVGGGGGGGGGGLRNPSLWLRNCPHASIYTMYSTWSILTSASGLQCQTGIKVHISISMIYRPR